MLNNEKADNFLGFHTDVILQIALEAEKNPRIYTLQHQHETGANCHDH